MIILGAELNGLRKLKDKSWSITINTQELSNDQVAEINSLTDFCYVALKSEYFEEQERDMLESLKADPMEGFEQKSPSQQLRSILFLLWKQEGGTDNKEFPDYYRKKMSNITTHFRNKLDI